MRYIDAEKIPWTDLNEGRGGVNVYVTFLEKVARMPAADVVEVVRCKDCRFHEDEEIGMVYCPTVVGGWVEDDWFCKGGEREDE